MPVCLLLSTYPIVRPKHGGQVRLFNIAREYERKGWCVYSISVYEPAGFKDSEVQEKDIKFPEDSEFRKYNGEKINFINDFLSGKYAESDNGGYLEILKKLPNKIDVIHVEQPWLWPLAQKIKKEKKHNKVVIVYGSQNIEYKLIESIFRRNSIVDKFGIVDAIRKLEERAVREADLVLAVTKEDLKEFESYGEGIKIIAKNGIANWITDNAHLEKWKGILPSNPWILYVSSAHFPNYIDFKEYMGEALGCIPPGSKLVIAGGVGQHIYNMLQNGRWRDLNLSRLQILGIVSEEDLSAIKDLASAFILPIKNGSGSNIKTAEAIYSGKTVVGTAFSFRGFEEYANLNEIHVCNDATQFKNAIIETFKTFNETNVEKGSGIRRNLEWGNCLAEYIDTVSKIVAPREEK